MQTCSGRAYMCTVSCAEKLEKVQIAAARVVASPTRHVPTRRIYQGDWMGKFKQTQKKLTHQSYDVGPIQL